MKKLIKLTIIAIIFVMVGGIGYTASLWNNVNSKKDEFVSYTNKTLPNYKSIKTVEQNGASLNVTYKTLNGSEVNKSINLKDIPQDYKKYLELSAKVRIALLILAIVTPLLIVVLGVLKFIIKLLV